MKASATQRILFGALCGALCGFAAMCLYAFGGILYYLFTETEPGTILGFLFWACTIAGAFWGFFKWRR